ncbi:PDZ and LIM domain protein 7-like [Babylonia areolata]|uniref:PDZ and LIM domain protein 7-like n=1 Tax=Babylonia areolata TaxID=304850 RepID=UPI003FD4B297
MASGDVEKLQLRRYDTSTPWGFRLQGGSEFNMPLYVAQVAPKSIADKAGVRHGDGILEICDCSAQGWSHTQAKQAMIRAGNEVDLVVQRGVVDVQEVAAPDTGEKRVELDEGSINPNMNEGSKYRNVMPKSYRILEQQLGGAGPPSVFGKKGGAKPAAAPAPAPAAASGGGAEGAKPSSIFDRKKQDRSDYLQAQGQTIQKAYGQKY